MQLSDERILEQEVDEQADDPTQTREYHLQSIQDGYRALKGIILGTLISEAILIFGGITDTPLLIFALIGLVFAIRHLLQIRQAKEQLQQLSQ